MPLPRFHRSGSSGRAGACPPPRAPVCGRRAGGDKPLPYRTK